MSELLVLPTNQEPAAVALYSHGFGDTEQGPIGNALARTLPKYGVAVVCVPLVDRIGESSLRSVAYSDQAMRLDGVIEEVQEEFPNLPCHLISHSQGAFATAQAILDGAERPEGSLSILAAPPLTGPIERLEKALQDSERLPEPSRLNDPGVVGRVVIPGSNRVMYITREFFEEVEAFASPEQLIRDACEEPSPVHILLAGNDTVLGSQQAAVDRLTAAGGVHSVEIIQAADHAFSKHRHMLVQHIAQLVQPASLAA